MEIKSHYKMFKAGKLWMMALVSAAVLGTAGVVHAADQAPATTDDSGATDQATVSPQAGALASASSVKLTASPSAQSQQAVQSQATTRPTTTATSAAATTSSVAATSTSRQARQLQTVLIQQPQAASQITVANPSNYPTAAATLVGQNSQGQPYYIYQIVNLNGTTLNNRPARMILAVDPANPQGDNYVYVTTDVYKEVYQTVIVPSGAYRDISVGSTGSTSVNGTDSRVFRVSNTAPFNLTFNSKKIEVPRFTIH